MSHGHPWTACLLTTMLIEHLEEACPEAAAAIDYAEILQAADFAHEVPDARAFLTDLNNWVPHRVLRELVRQCVRVTENPDFPYHAARAYFESAVSRSPSLLEAIAYLLGDVEKILRAASEWASGYFNYLQFQAFSKADEAETLYVLSQYLPSVTPLPVNVRFIQGNIEGIATLDRGLEWVRSEEQFSQVKLSSIVEIFGDAYEIKERSDGIVIVDKATRTETVTAKAFTLAHEVVPAPARSSSADIRTASLILTPDPEGMVHVYTTHGDPSTGSPLSPDVQEGKVLRIEQGGVLGSGKLAIHLREGAIYDAPYSRHRVQWRRREGKQEVSAAEQLARLPAQRMALASFLFRHLQALQVTQRRTLSSIMRNVELTQENLQLREQLSAAREIGGLIGKSQAIQNVLTLIHTVARSDATVLITGETGCGKELAARLIHQLSPRHERRFLAVNCGALAESLLESELFGHEKGAFTGAITQTKGKFELAEGGTLFLDEIGDVSVSVQVKLLRVLQEKEFQRVGGDKDISTDARLIAATNRDLEAMMEQKQFRRDLYYRLNVIQIDMPPLRERQEDIPILVEHFVRRESKRAGKVVRGFAPEALTLCLAYKWPGNVRELENVVERAITLAPENCQWIGADLLPPTLTARPTAGPSTDLLDVLEQVEWNTLLDSLRRTGSLTALLTRLEWGITSRAIAEYGGNKSRAAKALGRTYRWLRKLESAMTDEKPAADLPTKSS